MIKPPKTEGGDLSNKRGKDIEKLRKGLVRGTLVFYWGT